MASQLSYYMKIDGIRGDIVTKPYDGWIELRYCEFLNAHVKGYGAAIRVSKEGPKFEKLYAVIYDGNATPAIYQANVSGRPFPEAILVIRKGNAEILRASMKKVTLDGFHAGPRDLPRKERSIITVIVSFDDLKIHHGSIQSVEQAAKPGETVFK